MLQTADRSMRKDWFLSEASDSQLESEIKKRNPTNREDQI